MISSHELDIPVHLIYIHVGHGWPDADRFLDREIKNKETETL